MLRPGDGPSRVHDELLPVGYRPPMPTPTELLTAGKIAQELGASPGAVKKAIQAAKVKPATVKGGCTYYAKTDLPRIKKALE